MREVTRRQWLATFPAFAAPGALASTALSFNEDSSHFFTSRQGKRLTLADVDGWVEQYAGTQVRELILNVNCMRTSYSSKVWDPIWRGYDPDGPDDQPLLASLTAEGRKSARRWIHSAWQLHRDGIDLYARWIAQARRRKLSPWLSMRMNDVHNVDDERAYIHSEFWRAHPEYRRVPYRFSGWTDRAFDYGHKAVREYHLLLVRELAERYDFDGLELDWMRFGYHFRPGQERDGAALLTEFTAEVRRILDAAQRKRGHRIRLGARVASRPESAMGLGMDAVTWARRGLIDFLVVTPFWATVEPDMPIEQWRALLQGTNVTLAAGLELLLRAHPGEKPYQKNSIETVRGAAAALLDRGADRIYLFNFMDSETAIENLADNDRILREAGSLSSLAGKPRRHVITYPDTWAPGEPQAIPLPQSISKDQWRAFRLPTGPVPGDGTVEIRLGVEQSHARDWKVLLNGEQCRFASDTKPGMPQSPAPMFRFDAPLSALRRGFNAIEIEAAADARIVWVELAWQPAAR
ncbi:MAG: hypothetical protein JNK48_25020 [Bryobacterales bacterium]|nr:hypothetical protein [Bryobacterales bacterium]